MSKEQSPWKNFSLSELRCKCGCESLTPNTGFFQFMDRIQKLRDRVGFPLNVSSAYRCRNHPEEVNKTSVGQHTLGAIDFTVGYDEAYLVLKTAMDMGFTGIGVKQKGKQRFIHLDDRTTPARVWSY